MPKRAEASRNMLCGLLSLQTGLIDQTALVAAIRTWAGAKSRDITEILVEDGVLDVQGRVLIDALTAKLLERHGGDCEKSLAALSASRSTRESLARICDPDIDATLEFVAKASSEDNITIDRTSSFSVGTVTTDGQRFRVIRPHAKGGLGAVFVARDAELNREVALKQILDQHADDATSRARFLNEAEITGGLEHPGIVPVYGLGTYADGRPYYAMRFIRGESLKEAIAAFHADDAERCEHGARSLALRGLLKRFTDICNAIDYAHARGVLHRDLKPGNVIVGKHGETLVVDWGLAKATGLADPSQAERAVVPSSASGTAQTLPGSAMGTPAYMSPEQAAGDLERLGPGSDVYSLGATLFCLLTGKPPFENEELGELLRKVGRGEFARPRQLDPSIDPALEAVCVKAMAFAPEDRYATCRLLSDDIERWMADEPVSSWREPLTRRRRRWARRNRTAVASLAASVLVALAGTAVVLGVQTQANGRLQRANDRVIKANADLKSANEREKERFILAMDAIGLFHGEVSEDLLMKQKQFDTLRTKLLKGAADFYVRLENLLKGQTDRESRAALGKAYDELAALTGKISDQPAALAVHRKALAVLRPLASEPGAAAESKLNVARSLMAAGNLQRSTKDTAGARASYEEALNLAEVAIAQGGTPESAGRELGAAYFGLASVLAETGESPGALAAFGQALAIQRKLVEANPGVTRFQHDLANTHHNLGILLAMMGDRSGARTAQDAGLALRHKLAESNRDVSSFQHALSRSYTGLAVLLSESGDPAGALAAFAKALAILQKLADANPAVTQFQQDLSGGHNNSGAVLYATGDLAGALAAYRRALAIRQTLADANPAVTRIQSDLAANHFNVGSALTATGDSVGALAAYRQAQSIQQRLADASPSVTQFQLDLASSHHNIGNLLSASGDRGGALSSDGRALAIRQKLAEANPGIARFQHHLALSYMNVGATLSETGDSTGARAAYQKALRILQKLCDASPAVTEYQQHLATSQFNVGLLLASSGDPAAALNSFASVLAIQQKLADASPSVTRLQADLASSHSAIGDALSRADDAGGARKAYDKALGIRQQLAESNPGVADYRRYVANSHNRIADLLREKRRPAEACAAFRLALVIGEPLARDNPENTSYQIGAALSLGGQGRARLDQGDLAGAAADTRRALAIWSRLSNRSGDSWFETACCHATLAALAGRDGSGIPSDVDRTEADLAMGVLKKAESMGCRDISRYRVESALDGLRGRPDFKLLLLDLAFPRDALEPAR